jgi:phosphoglycolate phosphatase
MPANAGIQILFFITVSPRGFLNDRMNLTNSVRAVIFDLDGTLVESACEIVAALNRALDELGLPPLEPKRIEAMIGRGVRTLDERALQATEGGALIEVERAVERFEAHYAQTIATEARLYPGVLEGLRRLKAAGLPLAVVTNKPRFFTLQLLERAQVVDFFTAVVAGDDGIRRKPEPDMLLAACEKMGTPPAQTLMIGDSDNDIAAARAAGCPVWCVPYGYNEGRGPEALRCDLVVATIDEAAARLPAAAVPGA